ncbi:nicotinate-nucleotide adenylyltransferase [Chitinibacter tainanensis]|uniref:nicotinate-nucleotide adenylyltransferase n=1 Tax=Chitinibacter tainanensis TaxID=230667 RepID=UPI002357D117|nr:nicotinate-nucleotide adenylyltransferase [Chitinibacter tainanensis]
MRTIGVFGGTFDPIHYGHLALARCLRTSLALDEVRLIPTGLPPHRPAPPVSPQQRLAWVQAAIAGESGLLVDDREVNREGYCYTIDTLLELQQDTPDALLVWLIGADSWRQLTRWHRWRDLLEVGHLVIAARPEYAFNDLSPDLAAEFAARHVNATPAQLSRGKISQLASPLLPVSSTLIRDKLSRGEDVSALTPVSALLVASGLYCFKE